MPKPQTNLDRSAARLLRITGEALSRGADETTIAAYLDIVNGRPLAPNGHVVILDAAKDYKLRKGKYQRLTERDWKELGGLNTFLMGVGLTALATVPIEPIAVLSEFPGGPKEVGFVNHVSLAFKNGKPDGANQENIRRALSALGYEFGYDAFARVETFTHVNPKDAENKHSGIIDDVLVNSLWLRVDTVFGFRPSKELFRDVLDDFIHQNKYNSVRDYLDELKWDGVQRADSWLITYAGAADTELNRAISKLTLIAMVRRVKYAVERGGVKFDEMPVLFGPQGQGKSKLLRALPPKPGWFTDSMAIGDDAKKVIEQTRGIWAAEIAEMKGGSRETADMKAFLSRPVDGPVRAAYMRKAEAVPRQFVNFGSTNDRHFLKDPTGNRRYWPIVVTTIKPDELAKDRDQLWAEAVLLEATHGDNLHLPEPLWAEAMKVQEAHREVDPWEDILRDALDVTKPAIPVAVTWAAVGVTDVAKQDVKQARRILNIMPRLGYQTKKIIRVHLPDGRSQMVRCWVKDENQGGVQFPSEVGGDLLPF